MPKTMMALDLSEQLRPDSPRLKVAEEQYQPLLAVLLPAYPKHKFNTLGFSPKILLEIKLKINIPLLECDKDMDFQMHQALDCLGSFHLENLCEVSCQGCALLLHCLAN